MREAASQRRVRIATAGVLAVASPPVLAGLLPALEAGAAGLLQAALWLGWTLLAGAAYLWVERGRWRPIVLGGWSLALSAALFQLVGSMYLARSQAGVLQVDNLEFQFEVVLNSQGFRNVEFQRQKPPGVERTLFIGDSFVYGAAVPERETLPRILEAELPKATGTPQEWFNLGVNGANTFGYVQIARDFRGYETDRVLLGFYVDNDMSLLRKLPRRSAVEELSHRLVKRLRGLLPHPAADATAEPACIYPWVRDYSVDPAYVEHACSGRINPWFLRRHDESPDNHSYYEELGARFREHPVLGENILAIRDAFPGVPFGVVVFPSRYQVSADYFDELKKLGFRFRERAPVGTHPQQALFEYLEQHQIAFLDLLPAILTARQATGRDHYYRIDDHLNPAGNRLAAREIGAWLTSSGGPTSARSSSNGPD
ncbi:MAG: hypothetical protein MJE66_19405 [Proteobacteria bacterium]|nr:hypothetical protein [Pseudomonadota bacterium]